MARQKVKDDLYLHPSEMDKIARSSAPYFKLWVTAPEPVLVYVDTSEQQMLYDPSTYSGDYKSNLSIVTVMKWKSPDVFTFSNVVLPQNGLIPTTNMISRTPDIVYHANYMLDVSVKYTRVYDGTDTKKYAFYTLIDNDKDKRAYLLPMENETQTGQRRKTISAVQTADQSTNGKFVFDVTNSDYPPPKGTFTIESNGRESMRHCQIL